MTYPPDRFSRLRLGLAGLVLLLGSCAGLSRAPELYRQAIEDKQEGLALLEGAPRAPGIEAAKREIEDGQECLQSAAARLERALRILRQHPGQETLDTVEVACELGTVYSLLGENDQAAALLAEIGREYSDRPEPWMLRGIIFFNSQAVPKAEVNFKRALSLYQQRPVAEHPPDIYRYLGLTLYLAAKYEEALAYLDLLERLHPYAWDDTCAEVERHIHQLLEQRDR